MSEDDVSALKETLYAQQQLLQKLYNELEAEREASATAASEALSVILRLQGEKAAVRMEAEQYKRLSEEKIYHAEESLSIIEDVIYQKDMEVSALNHQMQAYRYKLLSMGCADPGFGELKLDENIAGEMSALSLGRRNSAPVSNEHKKVIKDRDGFSTGDADLVSRIMEERVSRNTCDQASDSDRKTNNSSPRGMNSYWEQMRKLDLRVKEITGVNSRSNTRSPSPLPSHTGSDNVCDVSSSESNESRLNETDENRITKSRNCTIAVDTCCSTSVHDVFEVPRVEEELSCHDSLDERDGVHPQTVKMDARDETDWLKKMLQTSQSENVLCQKSDFNCNLVVVHPRTSTSVYQLNRTSEIVEEFERSSECSSREEEMRMLNEIKQKLDLLHDEIRGLKVKKSSIRDEPSLALLSEAMLYFWL